MHPARPLRAASPIVAFYEGSGRDHRGRSLADVRAQGLGALERNHDYIQWLFPLPEPSSASPDAPVLTRDDIVAFNARDGLRAELRRSLVTMLAFYGLEGSRAPASTTIVRGPAFSTRASVWLRRSNHNMLRLTRILRSLTVLGCRDSALALFACLDGIHADSGDAIDETTLRHWRRAVASGPEPW